MNPRMGSLAVLAGAAVLAAGCGGAKKVSPPPAATTTSVAHTTTTATTGTGTARASGSRLSAADAAALNARLNAINAAIARRDRRAALRELAAFAALVRADAHRGKLTQAAQKALAAGIARTRQQIDNELPAKPPKGGTSSGPAGPTSSNSGFGH